ncbi:MAG: nucleoside monophosphate kinase [Candidatus Woesebacteria bacterium]|jgi:adenylate kinase
MKIVLIGIQGAGKSTQGNMLAEELGIPYLSSGHIFRQMAKRKSKLGRWLKETLNAGALVPDDVTVEAVMKYLQKKEYKYGFIIDGFPRTVKQAEAFSDGEEKVIFIDVSDKEALWRISGRISNREDETLQAIRKRIQLFHDQTSAVIDYYQNRGKLIRVNGEQEVEAVFKDILKHLKKSLEFKKLRENQKNGS